MKNSWQKGFFMEFLKKRKKGYLEVIRALEPDYYNDIHSYCKKGSFGSKESSG